jgi:hypothetical protein
MKETLEISRLDGVLEMLRANTSASISDIAEHFHVSQMTIRRDPGALVLSPWRPASKDDLFPPRLERASVTMEFLGYTKVKPVKRQSEYLLELPGEMRYATPGIGSSSLEEVAFYLRYLQALPRSG